MVVERLPEGGVRTPGWFISAVMAASVLMGIGWGASELRNRDITTLRHEMDAFHTRLQYERALRGDSIAALAISVRINTFRLCVIEERMKLPLNRLCVETFPGQFREVLP